MVLDTIPLARRGIDANYARSGTVLAAGSVALVDVTMLLCDYADAINGKLYISGAGWEAMPPMAPVPVALAVLVSVPWDQANRPYEILLELVDEDGHRISIGDPPSEVLQQGHFETGRPAGVPHGTPMTIPLALRFPMLPLPVGGYSFVLKIDGVQEARASFRVRQLT